MAPVGHCAGLCDPSDFDPELYPIWHLSEGHGLLCARQKRSPFNLIRHWYPSPHFLRMAFGSNPEPLSLVLRSILLGPHLDGYLGRMAK